MLHHIYCISGLGADFRIFEKLQIKHAQLHPIQWHVPQPTDTLAQYAASLARQIKHPNPVLLGVSFGGMLASEMANIVPVAKTIIVSSCKHRGELPLLLRTAGALRLHKMLPYWAVARSSKLSRFIFDTQSKEEELYLKQIMLEQTDLTFLKRAVHMILTWQHKYHETPVVHIHGRRDRLLTPSCVQANYWLPAGGHFMIWNEAEAVSRIINYELQK